MKHPTIRIEGAILTADILDRIEQGELHGQKPKDFGFEDLTSPVKNEIVSGHGPTRGICGECFSAGLHLCVTISAVPLKRVTTGSCL